MPNIWERLQHGWNAFKSREPTATKEPIDYISNIYDIGYGSSNRPDRYQITNVDGRSIISTIFNRIAVDVAMMDIEHVKTDINGTYIDVVYNSPLNNIFKIEANKDQTNRAFIKDLVISLFDEGAVAVVPTKANKSPFIFDAFQPEEVRVSKILRWYPDYIQIEIYNDKSGKKIQTTVPKKIVAIIENPFYEIMNQPNSTLKRYTRVLSQVAILNSETSSDKLNLLIQVPYSTKSSARAADADKRRSELERQLVTNKYGVGYIDGSEKVIQLNRAIENDLWSQAQDLKTELYNQLGLTQSVLDGTATDSEMKNYYSRTIKPVLEAICCEFKRKFLSKTARTQGQSIKYFRDPFELTPTSEFATITDVLLRNEVMTSNEIRGEMGWKPSDDPNADLLRNSNNVSYVEQDPALANVEETNAEQDPALTDNERTNQDLQNVYNELFMKGEPIQNE